MNALATSDIARRRARAQEDADDPELTVIVSALPERWSESWGLASRSHRRALANLRRRCEKLCQAIPVTDMEGVLGPMVSPGENETAAIHRWYFYKEAFSHRLPGEILRSLGAGAGGVVADVFGGVGTTALALQRHPAVNRVVSVEYSPFAHFAGSTKLSWHQLDPASLRSRARTLLRYSVRECHRVPDLAAFGNREIFDKRVLYSLLSARERINSSSLDPLERNFFLLGLAAVVEPVSGAMKDGRALRILRGRQRPRRTLVPRQELSVPLGDRVKVALAGQWAAMIEDVEDSGPSQPSVIDDRALHLRGDARDLTTAVLAGSPVLTDGSVGLGLFSPPYLNCIDYSEVYKLELWLLEQVVDQATFRNLRLGTLRSHPSVEFPRRDYFKTIADTDVTVAVAGIARFIKRNHATPIIGTMIQNYFEDMFATLAEQFRVLEPGGHFACIVGNSTFSGRKKTAGDVEEVWRLPVVSDVLIAGLAEVAGFTNLQIWKARELRARNARHAYARESVVVGQKPYGGLP